MAPIFAIYLVWAVWCVTWFAATLWVSPTIKRAGVLGELLYRVLGIVGFVLLFGFYSNHYDMVYRFWRTPSGDFGWAMVALVVAGFAFSWWARATLGPLWSGTITRKNNHRIVDTGPYALVRHPLYIGITISVLATAIVHGTPTSFLGAALMALGFYSKARQEERFLRKELGPEAYDAYAKRVPMLVPFPKRAGIAHNVANKG
ncbi:MAG: isoprenylcysteine carboxylmethyltransferase family protein [Rhizomicrobium sp.]